MLNFVIKKINRYISSKNDTATRNDFYYSKIYFKRIAFLYNSFNNKKEGGSVPVTPEFIRPLGLEFGMRYRQVAKQFNKPTFIYDNKAKVDNHKAVLVRHSVNDVSMLVQLQFFNDKLFFVGLDVSRGIHREEDKSKVLNSLMQKYLSKPFAFGDDYPIIQDSHGDFIIINDDVSFAICHLSGNMEDVQKYIIQNSGTAAQPKDKQNLFYSF